MDFVGVIEEKGRLVTGCCLSKTDDVEDGK